MTTEVEGEVREVGLTVVEQTVERLDETATPESMVELATRMADALADVVEKKKLYATIQSKKYPQVEAWMTIGRMDNVAAREVPGGITRVDGGGWEAEVELIRLSDGMRVGYGSAMCGTAGDNPWDKRPVHVQRSMAVTRATSRAFRQRYSWIMALAGYEPTPADEMPNHDTGHQEATDKGFTGQRLEIRAEGLIGTVATGPKGQQDFQLRQTADDTMALSFRLKEGNKVGQIILAEGALALELEPLKDRLIGQLASVWGHYTDESFDKRHLDGTFETIRFKVLHLERITSGDIELPAPEARANKDDDLSDLDF